MRLFLLLTYKRFQQELFRVWNIHETGCKISSTSYYFSSKLKLVTSNKIIKMVRLPGKGVQPNSSIETAKWILLAPLRGSRIVTGVSRFLLKYYIQYDYNALYLYIIFIHFPSLLNFMILWSIIFREGNWNFLHGKFDKCAAYILYSILMGEVQK